MNTSCSLLGENVIFKMFFKSHRDHEGRNNTKYFRGENSPLSNLFNFDFVFLGQRLHSSEQAYQMEKARYCGCAVALGPLKESKNARQCMQRARSYLPRRHQAWDRVKGSVMLRILRAKLEQCQPYRKVLLENESFAENTRHKFWGVGTDGQGKNMLGKLHGIVRTSMLTSHENRQ